MIPQEHTKEHDLQAFQSYFSDYPSAIREAKERGASHDYLSQVLIEFARKSFGWEMGYYDMST
jgi:hypothetical protein